MKPILKQTYKRANRYWQHEETGYICVSTWKPSNRWYQINKKQYEDYLSAQQGVQRTSPNACAFCGHSDGSHDMSLHDLDIFAPPPTPPFGGIVPPTILFFSFFIFYK